ncbi:penicillin acylase family protein [Paucibacter soli]|uniref:penicillin acylase family protein n=1 Tax=Paucibacter soli TaxID=3133433 RepID=UPI0030AF38F3
MRTTNTHGGLASALLAGALLAGCGDNPDPARPDPKPAYLAQIRRTDYGLPHISASDERGLGYGVGYAYAEDNFCLLADTLLTVNGERSKYFGAQASYDVGGEDAPNLPSDLYYKLINEPALVQASWERQTAEMQALVQGYVAGVNRYLREVGGANLPAACKGQPWVREIKALDLVRLMRHFAMIEDAPVLMPGLFQTVPPTATSAAAANAAPASLTLRRTLQVEASRSRKAHLGSNGVALGKDATESGAGLLLANPHFPWTGAARFYQLHLTIPGKLDVMGASLSGLPVVHIGFNKDLAWTHTVTESRHSTRYLIQLDAQDPMRYQIDGQPRSLSSKEISIEARNAGGGIDIIKRRIYASEQGPIVAWDRQSAVALRSANLDNDRMLQQWWAMDQAKSLEELQGALERIVGTPWVQTIAADKPGRALYANITPVPAVSAAKLAACVPAEFRAEAAQGQLVLNGNQSNCAWDEHADAVHKGIMPGAQLPSLLRNDYVQNSNDSAWMSHATQRLTGYPAIVSREAVPLSGRTRIGLQQIAARLQGSDGLGGQRFNAELLQRIAFSNRSSSATHLLTGLRSACEGVGMQSTSSGAMVDLGKACTVLQAWDGKAELTSIGWPLYEVWLNIMQASEQDFWAIPFDSADPVHTPRGLRVADAEVRALAQRALADAMQWLDGQGLDYRKPWGELQVAQRGAKRIPMHGGGSDDIYNYIVSRPIGDGQSDTIYGSSIVLTVSFDGQTPKAQGFLSYSQSSNPASPHYGDQTERFSAKQWISWPFSEAAIAADPKLTSKTLSE